MSEILVLAAHDGESVKKVTLELLTLARRFGDPAAVWLGPGADAGRERLAEYGAAKVYTADGDVMTDYVAAPAAEVLAALVAQASPAAVLVPATAEGKEVAGRLAVKIGSGVLTDAVDLTPGDGGPVAEQSIFGGAIIVKSKVTTGTPIVAVRPNAVAPEASPGAAALEPVSVELSDAAKGAHITERVTQEHLRRDPAPGRHADFEDHHGDQQGPGGADLRIGGLRRGRRPVQGRAAAHRGDQAAPGLLNVRPCCPAVTPGAEAPWLTRAPRPELQLG